MCTLSGEICLSDELLILTGSCLEISSDAFRIGLGATGLGAAALGAAGLGVRNIWPLREHARPASKIALSNIENLAGIDKSAPSVAVYALMPTR